MGHLRELLAMWLAEPLAVRLLVLLIVFLVCMLIVAHRPATRLRGNRRRILEAPQAHAIAAVSPQRLRRRNEPTPAFSRAPIRQETVRVARTEPKRDAARATIRLEVTPFETMGDPASHTAARRLAGQLELLLQRLAPHIDLRHAAAPAKENLASYRLAGRFHDLADRVRIYAEMIDLRTGDTVFRLRYQGLPSEEDKILAEILAQILKHSSPRAAA